MAQKPEPIIMNMFNVGGIADSDYMGGEQSFADLVGLDLHSQAGIIQAHQKLTKDSGTTIDEFVENIIPCSDGNTYMFSSSSGKIWKRTSAGAYSLVYTTVPTSGGAGCLGAKEYDGFLYWATQNYLHRIDVDKTGSTWSTVVEDNWKPMNIDQAPLGGLGTDITSDIGTSISETDTDKIFFTPRSSTLSGIEVYLVDKGTGDLTLTVHDSSNSQVGDAITITNGNLTSLDNNMFVLTSSSGAVAGISVNIGEQYHFHVVSTVADGTTGSIYQDELSSTACKIYAAGDNAYHPMEIQQLRLFIGDRNFVHQVANEPTGHIFSVAGLDLPKPHRIKALGMWGESLLIGTYISETVNLAAVFEWDTWSISFNSFDLLPEVGVNAFINADNYVFISAGTKGRIYSYDGVKAYMLKTIKGIYGSAGDIVYPNASVNFLGRPLIGFSTYSGTPHNMGIYCLARTGPNYPFILTLDYPISQRDSGELVLDNVYIGAMAVSGTDLFVSWKHIDGAVTTYGIDKIDYSNKLDKAYLETRIISFNRDEDKQFSQFIAGYRDLPTNTSISFSVSVNHGAYTNITTEDIPESKILKAEDLTEANTIQVKGVLICSGNSTPQIEDIRFKQRIYG